MSKAEEKEAEAHRRLWEDSEDAPCDICGARPCFHFVDGTVLCGKHYEELPFKD